MLASILGKPIREGQQGYTLSEKVAINANKYFFILNISTIVGVLFVR